MHRSAEDFEVFDAVNISLCEGAGKLGMMFRRVTPRTDLPEFTEDCTDDRAKQSWLALKKIVTRLGSAPSLYCEDLDTVLALMETFGSWLIFAEWHPCSAEIEQLSQECFIWNYHGQRRRSDTTIPSYMRCYWDPSELRETHYFLGFWQARNLHLNAAVRTPENGDYKIPVVRLAANGDFLFFYLRLPRENRDSFDPHLTADTARSISSSVYGCN